MRLSLITEPAWPPIVGGQRVDVAAIDVGSRRH